MLDKGVITLTPEQQHNFEMAVKRGILKELHRDKMLTDAQLSFLLSDLESQNTCAFDKNTCALLKEVI